MIILLDVKEDYGYFGREKGFRQKATVLEGKMDKKSELSHKITQIVGKLPLFPHDIDKLLKIAVKPSQDNVEILRLIKSDPGLSKELLQLARSYYGTAEAIEIVDDAVRKL